MTECKVFGDFNVYCEQKCFILGLEEKEKCIVARIVVFDDGWGGELVAKLMMREINIVEIVRFIDCA